MAQPWEGAAQGCSMQGGPQLFVNKLRSFKIDFSKGEDLKNWIRKPRDTLVDGGGPTRPPNVKSRNISARRLCWTVLAFATTFRQVVFRTHRGFSLESTGWSVRGKIDDPPDPADRLPHTFIYEIDC